MNGTRDLALNGTRDLAWISSPFHKVAHKQKAGKLAPSGLRDWFSAGATLGVADNQLADNPAFSEA